MSLSLENLFVALLIKKFTLTLTPFELFSESDFSLILKHAINEIKKRIPIQTEKGLNAKTMM